MKTNVLSAANGSAKIIVNGTEYTVPYTFDGGFTPLVGSKISQEIKIAENLPEGISTIQESFNAAINSFFKEGNS